MIRRIYQSVSSACISSGKMSCQKQYMARVKNTGIEREYGATPNERNFAEGLFKL
jgi:hypothetical protein